MRCVWDDFNVHRAANDWDAVESDLQLMRPCACDGSVGKPRDAALREVLDLVLVAASAWPWLSSVFKQLQRDDSRARLSHMDKAYRVSASRARLSGHGTPRARHALLVQPGPRRMLHLLCLTHRTAKSALLRPSVIFFHEGAFTPVTNLTLLSQVVREKKGTCSGCTFLVLGQTAEKRIEL
eukprot:scaffold227202_cov37-Tisochrysis_lutea.AAC.1